MAEGPLILIVDDEEAILDSVVFSLGFALKDINCRTATATTGAEALQKYQQLHPDLIILDVMLPDESGIEVCKKIRALGSVPILFLSAKDQLEDKVLGLNTGGDDYLPKPFKFEELLARVRALLRRAGTSSASRVLTFEDITLDPDTRKVYKGGRPVSLTLREYELLAMLMSKPRQVFTRQQILQHLWGWSDEIDTNVVEVYVCALRNKLDDNSRTLLRTVRGVGYALG
ncbi:response regulator transcription factor [bacterium]|nr:response regulator transcription factor [bacterium]